MVSLDDSETYAPVFISSATSSVSDDVAVGTIVYTAEAADASPLSFSLAGADAFADINQDDTNIPVEHREPLSHPWLGH